MERMYFRGEGQIEKGVLYFDEKSYVPSTNFGRLMLLTKDGPVLVVGQDDKCAYIQVGHFTIPMKLEGDTSRVS